jgi:hypothetical protein
MRRVRSRQVRAAKTQERTYWPGPWLQGTLAALGGSSVVAALVYALGWMTSQAQARFLGVPPGVFDRTACTFRAFRLLVQAAVIWVSAPILHLAGNACVWLAIACISITAWGVLWGVRKLGSRRFEWPRPLAVTEVALGVVSLLFMFYAIVLTSGRLAETSAVLSQEPEERVRELEQPLAVPCGPMSSEPSFRELLGEPEDYTVRCLISGAVGWALLAQALWSWSLWRRLGLDRRHCTNGWRALALLLAPMFRGALVLMLGLAGLGFLQVNGALMATYDFPVLENADASTSLLYLGHDGRFFYVYDSQEGKLLARKDLDQAEDSGAQGWVYAETENVVEVAYDTAISAKSFPGSDATGSAGPQGTREPEE